jgi:hypothetical protein
VGKAITQPKVLLVEGKDERYLFTRLITDLALTNIEVRDIGGKTKFRDRLEALMKISGHENITSVGILRDADTNPDGAFQSVCDALQKAGLPRPIAPLQPVGDAPQVTIMILPGGESPGMLEDVCLESVVDDPAMPCVDEFFQCLGEQIKALPRNLAKARVRAFLASREWLEASHFEHLQKQMDEHLADLPQAPSTAKIHTFLASKYKPNLDLGVAAQAGYWPFDHPAFAQVKQFLKML